MTFDGVIRGRRPSAVPKIEHMDLPTTWRRAFWNSRGCAAFGSMADKLWGPADCPQEIAKEMPIAL